MDTNKIISLLSEMAVFVNVVESGNFSKTAQNLGVTPSSVSRSITRLESVLEKRLLERNTRTMRLSASGEEIYRFCRDMLDSARMAVKASQTEQNDVSGLLRIAAPEALSKQVLMPLIMDFMAAYPKVNLQWNVTDQYLDPIGDEVDVSIQITDDPPQGLVARSLGQCRLVLCASPRYLQHHDRPSHPDDLVHHDCLCLGENPSDWVWRFISNRRSVAIHVSGKLSVNHSEIRREAVMQGVGISVFPEFTVKASLDSGDLIELLSDWRLAGSYRGQIVALYAQSKYVPKPVKTFIEYLKGRMDLSPKLSPATWLMQKPAIYKPYGE